MKFGKKNLNITRAKRAKGKRLVQNQNTGLKVLKKVMGQKKKRKNKYKLNDNLGIT